MAARDYNNLKDHFLEGILMKTVMKFLSLLLCFELIMAPMIGSVVMPLQAQAQEKSCPAGQQYNSSVNRCLTKDTVIQANSNVDTCRNISDEGEKKNCYARNAKAIAEQDGGEDFSECMQISDENERKKCMRKQAGGASAGNIAGSAAKVALPLLFMVKALSDGKKFSQCKPASLMLLYAGGAALLVGEVVSFIQHGKNLRKMEEARKNLNVKENADNTDDNKVIASEAQSQAFELLAKNEDSIAQVTKTKKITYGIATGLFAAGAIMGTIETIQYNLARSTIATGGVGNAAAVVKAQETVLRLTCQEFKPSADGKKNIESAQTEVKNANDAAAKANKTAAADGKTADANSGGGNEKGGGIGIDSIISIVTMGAPLAMTLFQKKPEAAPAPSADPNSNLPGTEENQAQACGEGQAWSASKKQCIQVSAIDINEILNLKYKKKAAQNVKGAKSYAEMMQLLAEAENMDFESFSRPSYYDEELITESLKDVPFYVATAEYVSDVLIGKAHAEPSEAKVPASKAGGVAKVEGAKQTVKGIMDKAVYSPAGRLITNGLMGTWMGFMTAHMSKQQKLSESRAELLRKMKTDFDTQGGITNCSSADRSDPGKPSCYCFTSDNKPNPATMENKVCNMKLAGLKNELKSTTASTKVCVNQNMTADPACGCKRNNSCMKVSSFKMNGINPGTFKMMSAATSPANGLFNGNVAAGDMDAGSIGTNAARLKEVADKMATKVKDAKKNSDNLSNALMAASAGIPASGPGYSSGAGSLPSSPSAAAAALDKELKDTKGDAEITTAGSKNAGGPGFDVPADEEPEFGLSESAAADQEIEIAEVMGQELDMGNSDISTSSSTNIFEVLSNRYKRSGVKRLQGDDTKVDAAAATDIAE